MAGLSQSAQRALVRRLIGRTGQYTAGATAWIGLSTANPGETGASNAEPSGNGYSALQVTLGDGGSFGDATDADPSVSTNGGTLSFGTASGSWGTITHFGIWSHATNRTPSDFLWGGALTVSKPVVATNAVSFSASAFSLNLTGTLSQYVQRAMLRRFLGLTGAYTAPATYYMALSSTNPGKTGSGITEPSGGGYAAVAINTGDAGGFSDPTDADPSVTQNSGTINFGTASGTWLSGVNLTHWALWSHATNRTATDFVAGGALTTPMPVYVDDTVSFSANQFSITLA